MPRAQARMTFGLMSGEASDDPPRGPARPANARRGGLNQTNCSSRPLPILDGQDTPRHAASARIQAAAAGPDVRSGGADIGPRPRSPQRTSRRGEVIGPPLRPTVRPLHCAIIW